MQKNNTLSSFIILIERRRTLLLAAALAAAGLLAWTDAPAQTFSAQVRQKVASDLQAVMNSPRQPRQE